MHPVSMLALALTAEEDRRRELRRRRWLDEDHADLPERRTPRFPAFRLPRFTRLADSKG